MDNTPKLLAFFTSTFFLFSPSLSLAGYAQLSPPPGWSVGTVGTGPTYLASNSEAWLAHTVRTSASLNVAGRAISVPVAMRIASNAPSYLAGRIALGLAAGLTSPFVIGLSVAGLLVLPAITDWISGTNHRWDSVKEVWLTRHDGLLTEYQIPGSSWSSSPSGACTSFVSAIGADDGWSVTSSSLVGNYCSFTATYRDAQGKSDPSRPDFSGGASVISRESPSGSESPTAFPSVQPALSSVPLPNILPEDLDIPWPVALPVINPSPGLDPVAQPLFVPTGSPVSNPNYNPELVPSPVNQPYLQPGVRVVPSPTPSSPWQVDVLPHDKPVPDSNPSPDPDLGIDGPPKPSPEPKPDTDTSDLCEKHPDILACDKLGDMDLTPEPLLNRVVSLSITPDTGWGPSGGSCPAPRTVSVMGTSLSMPFTMLCDFAIAINPLLVGFAWLSAALAFFGFTRRD